MKTILFYAIIFALILFTSVSIFGQAGSLDPEFGENGIAMFSFGSQQHDIGQQVAVLPDSSLLILGTNTNFSWEGSSMLIKVLPDGNQDLAWGTNGIVEWQFGVDTYSYNMELMDDGKILVSGVCYVTASDAEFFAARFNPDGSPDLTFNSIGHFIGAYSSAEEVCESMTVQEDGKIILAGRTYLGSFSQLLFMRINPDGSLDTGFGIDGYTEINASTQDERINALGILINGTIVGMGYGYLSTPWYGEKVFMAKLDQHGNPIVNFGTNGVLVPEIFTDISAVYDLEIHNDSIFATGWIYDAENNMELFITKLDSVGVADENFGNSGLTTLQPNPLNVGYELMRTPDGKLYVCGTSGMGAMFPRDFFLVRTLADGTLDPIFNGTGYVTTTIRQDWDEANALAIQADGKVVLAGFSSGLSTSGDNDLVLTRYLNDYIPPPPLTADFITESRIVCEGDTVKFTDLSTGSIVSWSWSFEGGMPGTSTLQNPEIVYEVEGIYDVLLTVSDGIQEVTLLKEDYIEILYTPAPEISGPQTVCWGFQETYYTPINQGSSYYWEVEGGEIILGGGIAPFVIVLWGEPGTGLVKVTEEVIYGCPDATDEYLVTIDDCTSIGEDLSRKICVYPNPANDLVNLIGPGIDRFWISNYLGQVVYKNDEPLLRNVIYTDQLEPGFYFLNVETINDLIVIKLIIE